MKRKSKLYSNPQKPFEKSRIDEENVLLKDFALKNKKEVWKTLAKINYFRKRAMSLSSKDEDREVFFNKLKSIGLNVETTSDVLDLKVEDLLRRRLPTIVAQKKIAETVKHARQLVVHKKILVNGNVVNTPSYIVSVEEEGNISLKKKSKPKPKPEVPKEEAPAESVQEAPAKDAPIPKPPAKPSESSAPEAQEKPQGAQASEKPQGAQASEKTEAPSSTPKEEITSADNEPKPEEES